MSAESKRKQTQQLPSECNVLFIEPFYGGSHKTLMDLLVSYFGVKSTLITLSAKKWHWRARCSALMLYEKIPKIISENILFCSSVLNLCELIGLRTDLQHMKKVVYFHENQLIYPVRDIKERDVQYAYNQITTCLAADVVVFNSEFNRTTFLNNIKIVTKLFPDNKPKELPNKIAVKCRVIYFPMKYPQIEKMNQPQRNLQKLHILWPHRWEFDKGPEDFFSVLFRLKDNNISFDLSILGESFSKNPDIFNVARNYLKNEIIHFGYLESKEEYFEVLLSAHVVVSTAKHEFFGVAMLEAAYCGCLPLVPNALVYPEIYPKECIFKNIEDLYTKLEAFALFPQKVLDACGKLDLDFNRYSSEIILPKFYELFKEL